MSTSDCTNAIERWIYTKLSGSTTITNIVGRHPKLGVFNIYSQVGLQEASYPMVIFSTIAAENRKGLLGKTVFTKFYYNITAISKDMSFDSITDIADEIESLFCQGQKVDDTVVIGCSTTRKINYTEIDDGVRYNHRGSEVMIFAYAQ